MESGNMLVRGDSVYIVNKPRGRENEFRIVDYSRVYIGRQYNQSTNPGVYYDRRFVVVSSTLDFGIKIMARENLSLIEKNERRQMVEPRPDVEYLKELPETAFWEGDLVKLVDSIDKRVFRVDGISYALANLKNMHGGKYEIFRISDGASFQTRSEDQIELIERGAIWNRQHRPSLCKNMSDCIELGLTVIG